MLLFWPLIGALIGVGASQKKGFSLATGIIGGSLLGPARVPAPLFWPAGATRDPWIGIDTSRFDDGVIVAVSASGRGVSSSSDDGATWTERS